MMDQKTETEAPTGSGALSDSIDRLWTEIKQISKQVENETRRSGRVTRLRLDVRRLERELNEVRARLGKAVYEARSAAGDEMKLHEVEGLAGGVAALDALHEQIDAKEAEITALRESKAGASENVSASEEVAQESASG